MSKIDYTIARRAGSNGDYEKTGVQTMSDTPLLDHDNPRVAAYARATGADRIDHEYNFWIRDMMREACEVGEAGDFRGVFRFDGNGEPHINDHDAFTAYLIERATEMEADRTESEPPAGP